MSCLYIFEISCLSFASFAIIFSHSEGCLFTVLVLCHSQHADVSSLGFSPQGRRVAAAALDITSDSPVERQEKGGLAQWRNISPCLSPFCHVKKKKLSRSSFNRFLCISYYL